MSFTGTFEANESSPPPTGFPRQAVAQPAGEPVETAVEPEPEVEAVEPEVEAEPEEVVAEEESVPSPRSDWTVPQLDEWATDNAEIAPDYPFDANKPEKLAYLKTVTNGED